ncbi:MAG: anthranilate synthase component I [Rhizobiales bacterium 65-9]|nr:anthranilate synthase component I [Hyphomicrobiales bacterium]OJY35390.1 MAG: anthranilate synthase component I [Rhizobiales bacterium 65-9]
MQFAPTEDEGLARLAGGLPLILRATLVADLETPVAAYLKLTAAFGQPSFLLESVEGGAQRGRYTMMGFAPDLVWRCEGETALVNRRPQEPKSTFQRDERPPLESLRALIAESAIPDAGADLPPMAAGLFGALGYDMVRLMEKLPPAKPDIIGTPDSVFMRPTIMAVFDNVKDELSILTPLRPKPGATPKAIHEAGLDRIERVLAALDAPVSREDRAHGDAAPPEMASNTPEADFLAMVEKAKDYIRAGDIFQVVLSQRFSTPFDLPAFQLYRALRRVNPAPFLCYLDFADFQIVCSSPEILVRVRDGKVTIRPIAGTRWRGATPDEDERLAQELLADPKERAEHLMLLDLGRNDVGRVSRTGSVKVTGQFFIERYSHVMHIVSNVEGSLDADRHDALSALIAGFPAGTVSGAPKIRAMEIIDELERDKRGIYGGCIGYFGWNGDMDTCIVLRTAIVKDGMMHIQAGAGVVYDSDPASEHRECVNKAKALVRAAEEAVKTAAVARRGQ